MKIDAHYEDSFDKLFYDAKIGGNSTIGIEIDVLPIRIDVDEKVVDVRVKYEGHYYDIVVPTEETVNQTMQVVRIYRAVREYKEVMIRLFKYGNRREIEFVF